MGAVTLSQVERALEILGGQAAWDRILEQLTKLRNGDYSYYRNRENYEKTAFQVIQRHCPDYKKDWPVVSHLLILHGRTVCTARSPKHDECVLFNICPSRNI